MPNRCETLSIVLFVWLVCGTAAAGDAKRDEIPTALQDYIARPEPDFDWQLNGKQQTDAGTVYDIALTSQKWHGTLWKHVLRIYEPNRLSHRRHVLLFVTGGSNGQRPSRQSIQSGLRLAQLCGARVAMLYQVPNQPLLNGRREDDLITETWLRYLKTGDATWPLLFPMVKSAVGAMDAVEAVAKSQWKGPISGFVVTGGSKRGWTSWLSPVADKRIVAIAPIVIDVLNFRPQMKYQLETWGRYSQQINDYTSKGLVKQGDETPLELRLRRMMDPYTYRKRLTLPKLIINGTNDPYWVVDATKWYWRDLPGPKYLLQVPNAGHSLGGGRELAYSTLAVFFRHVAGGTPMPQLKWTYSNKNTELKLTIRSSSKPKAARFWTASSETKDFRQATWKDRPLLKTGPEYVGTVANPKNGHVAVFGELRFEFGGLPYSLSTLVARN